MLKRVYKKIRYLSEGGFGQVYLVEEKGTHNRYAAKYIREEKTEQDSIDAEIKALSQYKHRSIVEYKDSYKDLNEKATVIVMEYCSGIIPHNT